MNATLPNQEFKDLRWGTSMPIALKTGSQIVQVRARGLCSLIVVDPQRPQEQVPDNVLLLQGSFS